MTYKQMLLHIDGGGVAGWKDTAGDVMQVRRVSGRMQVRWFSFGDWGDFDLEAERARWVGETFVKVEG